MRRKSNGFTLIELLVVISIIAVLAGILMPVFARARENARKTRCLSNVKQLGLAMLMYAQDYDEVMPFYNIAGNPSNLRRWDQMMATMGYTPSVPMNEGIMRCPSHGATASIPSYGYVVAYDTASYRGLGLSGAALTRFSDHTSVAMLMDAQATNDPNGVSYRVEVYWDDNYETYCYSRVAYRHDNGVSVCYLDGHAGFVPYAHFHPATGKYSMADQGGSKVLVTAAKFWGFNVNQEPYGSIGISNFLRSIGN